jgi:hypothetical protein
MEVSLRRGHRKVAARRFLMLDALGIDVPAPAQAVCESTIGRLPAAERQHMQNAAWMWAAMVTGRALRPADPRI